MLRYLDFQLDTHGEAQITQTVSCLSVSSEFERDMNTISAIKDVFSAVLIALLNLSVLESSRVVNVSLTLVCVCLVLQEAIGKHGLKALLATNALFCTDRETSTDGSFLAFLCSGVLQNFVISKKLKIS